MKPAVDRPYRPTAGARLKNAFALVVAAAVAYVLLRAFLVEVVVASDPMMAPGLPPKGWTLAVRWFPSPGPGDVVAFSHGGKDYVRRVVAVGGETIRFDGGVPVVDGKPVPGEAAGGTTTFSIPRAEGASRRRATVRRETLGGKTYEVWLRARGGKKKGRTKKVPAGHVFVACDNRAWCKDSRQLGTIPAAEVWGMRLADVIRRGVKAI